MDPLTAALNITQSILKIIQIQMETNLAELNALPAEQKTARAVQMATDQANVREFWQPSINFWLKVSQSLNHTA